MLKLNNKSFSRLSKTSSIYPCSEKRVPKASFGESLNLKLNSNPSENMNKQRNTYGNDGDNIQLRSDTRE